MHCNNLNLISIDRNFSHAGGGGQEVNFTQDNSLVITARVALGLMPVINAKVTYDQENRFSNKGTSIYDVRSAWGEGVPQKADERNKIS